MNIQKNDTRRSRRHRSSRPAGRPQRQVGNRVARGLRVVTAADPVKLACLRGKLVRFCAYTGRGYSECRVQAKQRVTVSLKRAASIVPNAERIKIGRSAVYAAPAGRQQVTGSGREQQKPKENVFVLAPNRRVSL